MDFIQKRIISKGTLNSMIDDGRVIEVADAKGIAIQYLVRHCVGTTSKYSIVVETPGISQIIRVCDSNTFSEIADTFAEWAKAYEGMVNTFIEATALVNEYGLEAVTRRVELLDRPDSQPSQE